MKPHLPIALLAALMGCFVAQAVEIPNNYHQISLRSEGDLNAYTINSANGKYAFLLESDLAFSTSTNETWTESTPLVDGGNSLKPDANSDVYYPGSISARGDDAIIDISYNGDVVFSGNTSVSQGGAIELAYVGVLNINHNADVTFSANTADGGGGVIFACDGEININDNADVTFSGNTSGSQGGAIAGLGREITININNNTDVTFIANTASSGGAIFAIDGEINIKNNADVTFSGNTATWEGGAIDACEGVVNITDNSDVTFSGNTANCCWGGAIDAREVNINNNADVSISGNSVFLSARGSATTYSGGGINSRSVSINNNGDVSISGNSIDSTADSASDSCGGAIYSSESLSICNNGDVGISGNFVSATDTSKGGAIYSKGSLSIVGNDSVTFSKNYERLGDTYRLRSIYMMPDSSEDNLVLAAKTGGHITFYDSVYMGSYSSGVTASFNADYEDANGVTQKAGGDIIFSGKYAAEHLAEIKGAAATTSEITNSRTSEINNHITLYGGSLQVVDGAKLNGRGLTVAADSGAKLVLRDGELNHAGYDITISSGSTLSAVGENTISASTLAILGGGKMHLSLDMARVDSAAVLTTTGNLSMDDISLDLSGTEYLVAGDYKLLTRTEGVDYDISGWMLNGATADQLRWEDGTLYYTGGHDWNHGVTDDDDISDLGEILGNLIINGGDITLDDVVNAIQDAVDAGFGHGQGHIVINRGGIHISGAGDLDGHIIFNGDLKDIRKLFIEKDITNIKIELGGNSEAENIVDVGSEYTIEIDELSGDGSMNKTGEGEMVIHGKGNKVGGKLDVQEGKLTFTVGEDSAAGETQNDTEVHELVIGNKEGKEAKVKVDKGAKVKGDKLHVDGKNAVVTNEGSLEFTEEVKVKGGHLDNNGSISKVTLEGGKVSGSGSFAGLEMLGGELVVGNSPGLQTYTDALDLTEGTVTFSLADAGTAATADTHGWGSAAYSTIDMSGNALTIGGKVSFVLEIGGAALESLVAADSAAISFNLSLIQNIDSESLTLSDAALSELLANTSIIITADAEGLTDSTLVLAGLDITSMLSNAVYSYEGNTLVFSGTVTNDGSLSIPEPTTATLSLLALAALAARRRRK